MKLKGVLISFYFAIGLIYTLYSWMFHSVYSHASFAYNVGRGLVWPGAMFPSVGSFIGGVVIIAFVLWLTLSRR